MIDNYNAVQIGHLLRAFARYVNDSAQKLGTAYIEIVSIIVNPLGNLAGDSHTQTVITVKKGLPCHLTPPPQNTSSRAFCPRAEPS
jgi:hypothetical protein